MNRSVATELLPNCPDREMLDAFSAGRLSAHLLDSIAEHIAGCPRCREIADHFPEDSDALISHLRACASDHTRIVDPECERLEKQASAIRMEKAPSRSAREWSAPLQLALYNISAEIGAGSYGVAFRGKQSVTGSAVVVKRLFPSLGITTNRIDQFRKTLEKVAPSIPLGLRPVIEAISPGDERLVVTPWIEGAHLGQIIADRKAVRRGRSRQNRHRWETLDEMAYLEHIQTCFGCVLKTLSGLHDAGLTHQGLKSTNIIVDSEDSPWLCDAGLHLLVDEAVSKESVVEHSAAAFVSPERWVGPATNAPHSDVFSWQRCYQALTLELPFGTGVRVPDDRRTPAPLATAAIGGAELLMGPCSLLAGVRETHACWGIRHRARAVSRRGNVDRFRPEVWSRCAEPSVLSTPDARQSGVRLPFWSSDMTTVVKAVLALQHQAGNWPLAENIYLQPTRQPQPCGCTLARRACLPQRTTRRAA